MSLNVDIKGVQGTVAALNQFPGRLRFKYMRIALLAAMGVVKKKAQSLARTMTGLLRRSIGVKVKIPQASYNPKHHDKPAYGLVGVRRRESLLMMAGEKPIRAKVQNLAKGRQIDIISSKKNFAKVRFALASGQKVRRRVASRYAHLLERGHGGPHPAPAHPFLAPAAAQSASEAMNKFNTKIAEGCATVAKELHAQQKQSLGVGIGI